MRYFYLVGIFILATVTMISCRKVGSESEENPYAIDPDDIVFPVITVSKPAANQVYSSGDSIIVEGKATDDKIVYKGIVQIKNDANNLVLAESYYESHFLQAINFRLAYKAIVTAATDLNILIEFRDHGDNISSASMKVKVNP